MTIPGFTADRSLGRSPSRFSGGSPADLTADGLVRPAMRCASSGDWNWCCAGSNYCCLWNGDSYYGCGWSSPY